MQQPAAAQFWCQVLTNAPTPLELPFTGTTATVGGREVRACVVRESQSLFSRAQEFAAELDISTLAVLLAGWGALLARYTGQDDLVLGLHEPAAGQRQAAPVPLRMICSRDLAFDDMCKRVEHLLSETRHMATSLTSEALTGIRQDMQLDAGRWLQVVVAITPAGAIALDAQAWAEAPVLMSPATVLQLEIVEVAGAGGARLVYDNSRCSAAAAERMTQHLSTLLSAALGDPGAGIGRHSPLGPVESERLLVEWNNTVCNYPAHRFLHQLFERQVELTPGAQALEFGAEHFTYQTLNKAANKLARHLLTQGDTAHVLIGVYMQRSAELVIALLAILKTGAAYVPLDPAYPQARIAYMIDNAGIATVLTQSRLRACMPPFAGTVIELDHLTEFAHGHADTNLELPGQSPATTCAYVIYTSGSTGLPKGIRVAHNNVVNFVCSMAKTPGLQAEDTFAAVTTISFDIHVLELYLPLCVGARLVLVDDTVRTDGSRLGELLRDRRVTAMQATPATWRLLLDAGWEGSAGFKALCGGEALARDLAVKLLTRVQSLWNMYGPTEATVWSACARITDPDGPLVIGRPIANTQIHVLDERLRPVPVNVTGEICIGGEGVALGYLGNAGLTHERFVDHPFSTTPGARLYRTGDLGRYLDNGDLECLGRNDQQVKLRGFRIELGEIEAVLRLQSTVQDAAVVAKSFGAGDQRLVAYVVAEPGSRLSVPELRSALRDKLPDYMMPSFFIAMNELPLTPNRKLDRKRLMQLDQGSPLEDGEFTEPASATEQRLLTIWKNVLKVPHVSPNHTFFEQGGTSLLLMPLAIQIEKALKIRLSPGIIAGQTPRQLAAFCETKQAEHRPASGFLSRLFSR